MIHLLATRYNKFIAYFFFLIFWISLIPLSAKASSLPVYTPFPFVNKTATDFSFYRNSLSVGDGDAAVGERKLDKLSRRPDSVLIDGPSQPEMSSFQAAGTNNMVNLFTGDFSYNIPLLDVGGYPVNIFYNGGITPEQEASWVGLGWNINPGTVSRNMRGIPDDFDGTDMLKQYQQMKPNKTFGFRFGPDFEFGGVKAIDLAVTVGASFNNYLGPAMELGVKGGVSASVGLKLFGEKYAPNDLSVKLGAGAGLNLSSRNGVTASANASLTARFHKFNTHLTGGLGVSTSYNSRTGIKGLELSEQVGFNYSQAIRLAKGVYTVFEPGQSARLSSSLSFVRPSYIPAIRAVTTNQANSFHFQLGLAAMNTGSLTSVETEVYYQNSAILNKDTLRTNPMFGYLYYDKATGKSNAVMDMTRFNDREVTPSTPVISAPQYSYDVFAIQGEGTGGSVRAYRNDLGYVRDNLTVSKDESHSGGADIGPTAHYGINFNSIQTPSTIGDWNAGNKLPAAIPFRSNSELKEAVYFRSPGEASVVNNEQLDKIAGLDLVRFKLGGSNANPTIEPVLEKIGVAGQVTGTQSVANSFTNERRNRTQVVSFLTAEEASIVGLNKKLESYDPETLLDVAKHLKVETFSRTDNYRKPHHISQVNVTENGGRRYVYGIPVYNLVQRDFSFTVSGDTDPDMELVSYDYKDSRTKSDHLSENAVKDGYVQVTETPAYAHSFLLSGLLSPDYVDVKGDGISEDDLGTAIKFNYTRVKQNNEWAIHKWRTPHGDAGSANFNAGNRSEVKDDKGIVSYGERESWYMHSIESKTMIAVFRTADRVYDGKSVRDEYGGVNAMDKSSKQLQRIDLYNKADLKRNGEANARPIKSVHFGYSNKLCPGTPENYLNQQSGNNAGKLTLEKIWFTYNGQNRVVNEQYLFSYGTNAADNPSYSRASADRWGNYKPVSANPSGAKNKDYAYTSQTTDKNNEFAGAWSLKKVLLPSGGQLEVEYESDDYAYVQNLRASQMMQVLGLGSSNSSYTNTLYNVFSSGDIVEKDYVFIKTPEACAEKKDVYQKYLDGQTQLAFKIAVTMPGGQFEYIPCYAFFEDYGRLETDKSIIWVKLKRLDGINPISLAAVDYLREQLPAKAFPTYDLSEANLLQAAGSLLKMLLTIGKQLQSPILTLRQEGKAWQLVSEKSFVRINNPKGQKFGGGHRVKSVRVSDNWKAMEGKFNSVYGQTYDYTTEEIFHGATRTISSGVASYEPTIGGEENPFQKIMQVADQLPMGPTSYGAVEMPVLDAFFPAALVGYSKVTVKSLPRPTPLPPGKKSRSGVGRQVTEFFTAKDYPVYYTHSSFDPASDKQTHWSSRFNFFHKSAYDYRALSQGFLVATNDMHGQLKAQSSYAENDPLTRISYTRNYYRNTGEKGLNDKFDFVHVADGGEIKAGNIGIDVELMTDAREFSVKSRSEETQAQVDMFFLGIPFPWFNMHTVTGKTENIYRAVTTTKVINYHAVLDRVVVIDKGSTVSTENLLYDAQTGAVIVSKTNNEFDKPIYNVNYPAYWAFTGMGLASDNIDAVFSGVNFLDGKILGNAVPLSALESGDEVYIINTGAPAIDGCESALASPASTRMLWVYDKNKYAIPANNTRDLYFIDAKGVPYTRAGVSFRIIRSGKRNMLGAVASTVSLMTSPIVKNTVTQKSFLTIAGEAQVINASAADFGEKWQTDNNIIRIVKSVYNPEICDFEDVDDCTGEEEKTVNPYRKGLLGNYRALKSLVFYSERKGKNLSQPLDLSSAGFLDQFQLYWTISGNRLIAVPDAKWVIGNTVSRINSKGMELETYDAMGIYSAAQYGFNKTMPVAIADNARSNEMFAEGFEDASYDEMIRNITLACRGKHVSLPQPVKARDLGFKAHTGQHVLPVAANSTVSTQFPIGAPLNQSPLAFGTRTAPVWSYYVGVGGATDYLRVPPNSYGGEIFESDVTHFADFGSNVVMEFRDNAPSCGQYYDNCNTNNFSGEVEMQTTQYMKVDACGRYNVRFRFDSGLSPFRGTPANGDTASAITSTNQTLEIYTYDGQLIYSKTNVFYIHELDYTTPVDLAIGHYKVVFRFWHRAYQSGTGRQYNLMRDMWTGFFITPPQDSGLPQIGESYESLSSEQCTGLGGVTTSNNMMNPVFSLMPNQKMLFSAWVKGNCNNVTTTCDSKVMLDYEGGSTQVDEFHPTGPMIEGWQRYEGVFTVPQTQASKMNLRLVNSGSSPVYYDDIRMHPFKSNMKSYIYDPVNMRLVAELDANNYASFYEYDFEGTLIRTKAETREGIKTVTETRSAKQKMITDFQQQ